MKKVCVFLLLALSSLTLSAQDLIVTRLGETINAFQVEVGELSVFYQLDDSENSSIKKVPKVDVVVIKKSDGSFVFPNPASNNTAPNDDDSQIERVTLTIPDSNTSFNMIKVEGMDQVFYIGETEVTQGIWNVVMGSKSIKWDKEKGIGDNMPAYNIDWYKANEFCEKLSLLYANSDYSFSLPTYSQWLCAARGGKYSKDYTYSGSDESKDVAWYKKNSGGKYHNVKSLKPNELGLYDMSGNVGEWCLDDATPRQKVLAGGTIDSSYSEVQISSLGSSYAEFKHGFRIIMVVK